MKTTQEAAQLLGVSKRRVTALIEAGKLEAEKASGIWLIDEESLNHHARSVKKQGGRPKKGDLPQEAKFLFKNRTHDIAELVYDTNLKEFTSIGPLIDAERAPLGLAGERDKISLLSFNLWWRGRGLSEQRPDLGQRLSDWGLSVPFELSVKSLGLSLSDQYWICPYDSDLRWEDLNFFSNSFPDSRYFFAPQQGEAPIETAPHPDNTSDGVLTKHWAIVDGKRCLFKAGSHLDQEPYNEVVASRLHARLLPSQEYVEYDLAFDEGAPLSVCPIFIGDTEEFIPAQYVVRTKRRQSHHNDYRHYVECCLSLGIETIEDSLARMIVCDDILANTDRHWRNFGIIRNVETLECRPAPLFDSGTSLWCTKSDAELSRGDFSFASKQFNSDIAKQLMLANDLSWIRIDAFDGFVAEACEILGKNEMVQARIPSIRQALEKRVERIQGICRLL